MRYLVIANEFDPFVTEWFSIENNFVLGMKVFDLVNWTFYDGSGEWKQINFDHL